MGWALDWKDGKVNGSQSDIKQVKVKSRYENVV